MKAALERARAAGLCTLYWHVRHFRTGSTSDLEVIDCDGTKVLMSPALASSSQVDRFAIVDHHGVYRIGTSGRRGRSTLDEYQRAIPAILDATLTEWTAAKKAARGAADAQAQHLREMKARVEQVQKSFDEK